MTLRTMMMAGGALLILGGGWAHAGPCTQQINELSSTLGWQDAGSGPTPGSATSSARPEGAAHPPTAATNKAAEGRATSADDANRQTTGRPTASEQAQGATASVPNDQSAAKAALARARALDSQGSDACKQAVQEARNLVGHTE
jgi:hypothetical protein